MHHFAFYNDEMYCEDVPLREIAEAVGTPCYVYSHATLTRHFNVFSEAFQDVSHLVCFSAKANSSLAVLKLFADLGGGLDIVSGGELYRGLQAGFAPDKIVYSGVGKRVDEIDEALAAGILMINVESPQELAVVNERAGCMDCKAPISFRVNPDVDPKTHPYISTGLAKNKFGMDVETALECYRQARDLPHVDVRGVDCHIGSQITEAQPFHDALLRLLNLIEQIRAIGIDIRFLDVGGGLGITYSDEAPPHPFEYARALCASLQDKPYQLILEPGRVIVGNAGILLTRVLYRKANRKKEFVVVDAAMNDLMRPTLYQAYHSVVPVQKTDAPMIVADVVGPICESGDFLAQQRSMPDARSGDLIAVMSAGAYGYTMSSNYCSRLKPAEVMVCGSRFHTVRSRQGYPDLTAGESIPDFLKD